MRELMELLEAAGHVDFRDARGPMGFTQRQAGGKFTGPEAAAFIEQLQSEIHGDGPPPGSRPAKASRVVSETPTKPTPRAAPRKRRASAAPSAAQSEALSEFSSEDLAAELQLRGWIVAEP